MSERNFSEELKINRFKLETECERQPSLYHYYADQRAKAKAAGDSAEDSLKLTIAEVDQEIRKKWNEDSDGKQTEKAIENKLQTHKKILAAKDALRDAAKALYTLDAAVSALEHRKNELDNLVTLLVKGFYAAPHGGKQEGVTEEVESEVRKGLNKGKERK